MEKQKKRINKVMQWLGFIIVMLSILVDGIILNKSSIERLFGISYFSWIGFIVGAGITIIYTLKENISRDK
ncbi:hypothetical protein SAMN05421839_1715 [Halolactibacillus halophilus]|uniref:Uncharacterized protein n=1 Tax=Halolactibacillus halophilus TaxID=306540 RepID=A0A1I5TAG3_9BACI|nr:hypothetical protein [Halolactibacillus halophilus]GEM03009.1 hypothetical protein HHA03_25410 [Halolactibacillus halophilus]SFP80034.1 hypothetical protein SAMN05421839_1715 [Halolactibacillus halophilus]